MARLTPEQRAALEKQLADDDAAENDFEVEIWNERGQGARVPFSKGRQWLADAFGIDLAPAADDKDKGDAGKQDAKTNVRPAHFGGQQRKTS